MLAAEARTDAEAAEELVRRMLPLAVSRAARLQPTPGCGMDDMRQEACLAVLEAARAYDPARAPRGGFASFAVTLIDRRLASLLAAGMRRKRRGAGMDSLERPPRHGGGGIAAFGGLGRTSRSAEDVAIGRLEAARLLKLLAERLSALERAVVHCRMVGLSLAETAAVLGVPPKACDNAMGRVRGRVAAAGFAVPGRHA